MAGWLALAAALGAALIPLGNVFPDEGWYLYAGRLVAEGRQPYRDFAFFQAPLGAYVFAIVDGSWSAGRALSLAFGLGAIALTLDLARRRGPEALAATGLLLATATYTLRWYAVSRNIAPAAFFLALGASLHARRAFPGAAAVAIAVAAGIRLSAAGGLAALVLAELGANERRRALASTIAGTAALIAIAAPFAAADPALALFNVLDYHTALHPDAAAGSQVWSKLSGLLRLADHHHLLVLALVFALVRERRTGRVRRHPEARLAGWIALCVTGLHLIPGRLHPEYHELILPQLALVAGIACAPLVRWLRRPRTSSRTRLRRGIALLAAVQLAGCAFQLHALRGWSPWMLTALGAEVARIAPPGQPILTFVPDIALASGLPLVRGLEMGSVSLAAPDTPLHEAARRNMVTLRSLALDLKEGHPGAVVWRGLADADPRRVRLYPDDARRLVERMLTERYEPAAERSGWTIWRRRTPRATGATRP